MERFKSLDRIKQDVYDNLYSQGIFNPTDESLIRLLVSNILEESINDLENIGTKMQQDMHATTATNLALDAHAKRLGLDRITSSNAYDLSNNNFMVYISNNKLAKDITTDGGGIFIPQNTMVYTTTGIQFRIVNPIYIPPEGNSAFSPVISTDVVVDIIPEGSINTFGINLFETVENITLTSVGNQRILCTNRFQISGGTYAENDGELRHRMFYKTKSYNDMMLNNIRTIAIGIPDINDIRIFRNTHGVGTIGIMPITADPMITDGLALSLQETLEPINDGSLKIIVPEYISTIIHNKLYYSTSNPPTESEMEGIKAAVAGRQKDYINNLMAGQTLYIDQLQTVGLGVSEKLRSVKVTCVKLDNRVVSIANQKAMWDEKFVISEDPTNPPIVFVEAL